MSYARVGLSNTKNVFENNFTRGWGKRLNYNNNNNIRADDIGVSSEVLGTRA